MKTINCNLNNTILYYRPLLARYARRLINNETMAALLAEKVLEDQYEIDGLIYSDRLRQILKFDLRNRCFCYTQLQIFDRAPVKVAK